MRIDYTQLHGPLRQLPERAPAIWKLAEGYLDFQKKGYRVTYFNNKLIRVSHNERKLPWISTTFKILSYLTIVLPLLANAVCNSYRKKYPYEINEGSVSSNSARVPSRPSVAQTSVAPPLQSSSNGAATNVTVPSAVSSSSRAPVGVIQIMQGPPTSPEFFITGDQIRYDLSLIFRAIKAAKDKIVQVEKELKYSRNSVTISPNGDVIRKDEVLKSLTAEYDKAQKDLVNFQLELKNYRENCPRKLSDGTPFIDPSEIDIHRDKEAAVIQRREASIRLRDLFIVMSEVVRNQINGTPANPVEMKRTFASLIATFSVIYDDGIYTDPEPNERIGRAIKYHRMRSGALQEQRRKIEEAGKGLAVILKISYPDINHPPPEFGSDAASLSFLKSNWEANLIPRAPRRSLETSLNSFFGQLSQIAQPR